MTARATFAIGFHAPGLQVQTHSEPLFGEFNVHGIDTHTRHLFRIHLVASAPAPTSSGETLVTIPLILPAQPRGKSQKKAKTFTISKNFTDFH
jgi:hypothetical protein